MKKRVFYSPSMKRQVIDELQMSLEWSQRNIFAYAFPLDVLRTIFRYLTPQEYFRYAHSLCKRMRQYLIVDVFITRVVIGSDRKRYEFFNFHALQNFSLDGIQLKFELPELRYKIWKRYNTYIDRVAIHLDGNLPSCEKIYRTVSSSHNPCNYSMATFWKSPGKKTCIKRDDESPAMTSHFSHLILEKRKS
jgi:hypothetical protein